jgi:zinc protease
MRKAVLLCALLLPCWLAATQARANPYETTLANGMRVIVREDHRAPTVVHMVWYRVGAMDEVDGSSGLAHALEHMMFKGTPKIGAGEFSRRVAAAGGRDNAFTAHDFTSFFQQVPRERLSEMMQLEADRMQHLTLDAGEFQQEMRVIREERRLQVDDQPQSQLFEQLAATAFLAHPYRRPVIGWMGDLDHMEVRDLRDWYARWYAPNNAILVVVGDVDYRQVFLLAQRTYGALKARALPPRKPREEPPQMGQRRFILKAPAELPTVVLGYQVPVVRDVAHDVDPLALRMLAVILDGYEAARLNQSLVRERRLAVSVGVDYEMLARGPGLFSLYGSPAPGQTPGALEAALRGELARVQSDGIGNEELARARAQLLASEVYKLDSMFGQAMEIGQAETVGVPYADLALLDQRLQEIDSEEIQAVARKYFSDDALTVGLLDPLPSQQTAPAGKPAHRH